MTAHLPQSVAISTNRARLFVRLFAAAALIFSQWEAMAVTPQVWRTSTYDEFAVGEVEKVSIHHPGEIRLAPSSKAYSKIKDPSVWSLVESPDGKTLYAGTGNKAKIYKIAVDPKAATAEAVLFADLDGSAVHAMLPAGNGSLYAGVSPSGTVFKIDPEGAVKLVGSTDEKYIWGMTTDATGDLILGTGDKGLLVKMKLDGKTSTLLKTKEKHILSMISEKDGKLYFGTAPKGWVAVLDEENDFRILYDSDLSETKALARGEDGALYAAVLPEIKVEPKRDSAQAAASAQNKKNKNSELVRISPEGTPRTLLTTDNAAINTLYKGEDGLLVGTGDEGKLFGLGYRDNLDLIAELGAGEILAITPRKGGGVWLATGNPAAIHAFPIGTGKGGTFASDPLDAKVTSIWGAATWKASVPEDVTLELQTRSGNTEEPDDNWSDWSDPIPLEGKVASPPARFLQWRAKFGGNDKGESATIHEVEIVHQQANQPPVIESVQVGGANSKASGGAAKGGGSNGDEKKGGGTSSRVTSAKKAADTKVSLSWKAADSNGDTLINDVHYRRVGETLWKEIETDLAEAKYIWDTAALPDGDYEIKISVSDRLSNPPGGKGQDEWISEPTRVDKTAPEVVEWKNQSDPGTIFEVDAVVRDKTSRLSAAEYLIDGDEEERVPLFPEDGILDSSEENFEIAVEDLEAGEHSLTLRVRDEQGNIGTESIVFQIP